MENVKSLNEFVKENKISIKVEWVDNNPNMADDFKGDHWKVVLRINKRQFTTYFSKGYGHNGAEPQVNEVLDCLASDAAGYDNARDFEDWASEYGYDTNSRKAEKIYNTIAKQAKKLEAFLGSDLYQKLLFETERM